jgi:tRNA pseudouridine38-40 synthase
MTKYLATIQYNGKAYAGWQVQKDQPSVQGTIREALARVTGETVSVVGAGRTDAGVHALGQVAHFRLQRAHPPERLVRSLNGVLPRDIRIMRLITVAADFHAQKHAVKKQYRYRIYNGPVLSPFLEGLVLHVISPLNLEAMQAAASQILGDHDFRAFTASSSPVRDSRRSVFLAAWQARGRHLDFRIEASGFLHHMVRNVVGTLLQIGREERPPADIREILQSGDRRNAGPTAPPQGLYLVKIWYP